MIVSGAMGGLASALLNEENEHSSLGIILKRTFIGIVATLTVPLFLNLFSSDLLDAAQDRPLKLLIFSGLCIIFSLFSFGVLDHIYGNRSKDEGRHPQELRQRRGRFNINREHESSAIPEHNSDKAKMSENQLKILQVIAGNDNLNRTLSELMRDTGILQRDFEEALSLLMVKGFVAQELSGARKLQFVLTTRGKQRMSMMSGG